MMNLKELARARGTNLKRVAEECGIPASTLYAISSGETTWDNVGIGLFIKLADTFEIDTEELYRLDSYTPDVSYAAVKLPEDDDDAETPAYADDERELIDLYRAMSVEYREMLVKSATAYAAMSAK